MSYQVLARKWRPRSFRELVGQQHVLQALVNALDHNRLHHAYLFTGTRGVGKTTIARILARCLNCETGVSSEPCGQCGACLEINEGRFVDLIEVDAASRTKVEDTRELLENVQYAPTRGRYKVYLIDEVHMLSSHSFNALLKTLEEPPPHVKFLLATTDPQKLPITILSRCLQFHLKNMEPERIVGHLQHVLEQEMVPFEEPALWLLGRAADGSMRDAMSLTDQAIAFGSGKVIEAEVGAMLGTIDQSLVFDLLTSLADGDGSALLSSVERLSEHSPDYAGALAEVLSVLHRIAIAQAMPDAIDNSRGDRDKIIALAQRIASENIQLFYQTALLGRRDLPMSPDPRAGFEMVLLRMLAFRPQGVHSVPTQALAQPEVAATATSSVDAPVVDDQPAAQDVPLEQTPQPVQETQLPVTEPQPTTPPMAEAQLIQEPQDSTQASPPVMPEAPPWQEDDAAKKSEARSAPLVEPAASSEPVEAEWSATEAEPKPLESVASELESVVDALSGEAEPSSKAASSAPVETSPLPSAEVTKKAANEVAKLALADADSNQWIAIYTGLGVGGVLQSTVSNTVLDRVDGSHFFFTLDQANSTLYDEGHQQRLSELLSRYFDQPIVATIQLGQVNGETPAAYVTRKRYEQQQQALADMHADSMVQSLLQQFNAVLDEESVTAVDV